MLYDIHGSYPCPQLTRPPPPRAPFCQVYIVDDAPARPHDLTTWSNEASPCIWEQKQGTHDRRHKPLASFLKGSSITLSILMSLAEFNVGLKYTL